MVRAAAAAVATGSGVEHGGSFCNLIFDEVMGGGGGGAQEAAVALAEPAARRVAVRLVFLSFTHQPGFRFHLQGKLD